MSGGYIESDIHLIMILLSGIAFFMKRVMLMQLKVCPDIKEYNIIKSSSVYMTGELLRSQSTHKSDKPKIEIA